MPLDWLIFGAETAVEGSEIIADRAAQHVVSQFGETPRRYNAEGYRNMVTCSAIPGLSPEDCATDLGMRAGEFAAELLKQGASRERLLTWRQARTERAQELLRDRVGAMTKTTDLERKL